MDGENKPNQGQTVQNSKDADKKERPPSTGLFGVDLREVTTLLLS
jgi:hypothetical protein